MTTTHNGEELQSIDEERCKRCRRKLKNHAQAKIAGSGVTWICPTTDGQAVSDEIEMKDAV